MKFAISLFKINYEPKSKICKLVGGFLHNSSNPRINCFQHAVAKHEVLTSVPSKKYSDNVKMSNILRNILESHDHAMPPLLCF